MKKERLLPQMWISCQIGELSNLIHYGYTVKSQHEEVGPKLLRITDIQENTVNWDTVPFCEISDENLEKYILKKGDFVFARTGATVGKSFLIENEIPKSVFASYLIRIILNDSISKKYVSLFFNSYNYWIQIQKGKIGIGQPNVNSKILAQINIPLPPLAEQHRIVEKIEEEFTRLDAGVSALKRAKALIPKYRQSVLKAAMCGDLTKEWRAANPDVESAEVLVENLTSKNEDYKYIDPDFPKNWILAPFSAMSERVTVGHVGSMKNEYTNDGIPFLRGQNVRANRYDPKGLKYISRDFHNKLKKSSLQPGDLVVVRSGDVGVSCVIPDYLKEANCSDLIIVKQPKGILAEFAAYFMNSAAKKQINSKKVGVALTHFNTKSMAKTMIPVPPLEEQHEIVSEIERRFSIIDEMERVVDESLIKAERLRQSVLKKAFEGRLVEQSPDDEPAGVLLERIRAEKEMQAAEGKANGKKRKK